MLFWMEILLTFFQSTDAMTMVMLYLPGYFSRTHPPSLACAKRTIQELPTPRIHNVLTTASSPTVETWHSTVFLTDFQYRFYLFYCYIHSVQHHTLHQWTVIVRTVTVIRESNPTQKLQRSFSCRSLWKRSFSHSTLHLARSLQTCMFLDNSSSNEHCFFCVPECSSGNKVDHPLMINDSLTTCQL